MTALSSKLNKQIFWCLLASSLGVGLRFLVRPSSIDLSAKAVEAWNARDVVQAELFARKAISRNQNTEVARDVLVQVALHNADPRLHIAALLTEPESSTRHGISSLFSTGEVAFQYGYASIAEDCWTKSASLFPSFSPNYDRLIMLASIRIDSVAVRKALIQKSHEVAVGTESIRLFVGSEFIESESEAMEPLLRRFVENDPSDQSSRIALARCLTNLDRPDEALAVLKASPGQTPEIITFQAFVTLHLEGPSSSSTLPDKAPESHKAEYWYARSVNLMNQGKAEKSLEEFEKVISLRPLNRKFRAKYCEYLRLANQMSENQRQSEILRTLQEMDQNVKNPSTKWDDSTIRQLQQQCLFVGAKNVASQIEKFLKQTSVE